MSTRKPSRRRRGPGRPPGATTQDIPSVRVDAGRCPRCGSSRRSAYRQHRELSGGTDADGHLFAAVVIRRCDCRDCGLTRDERTFEYLPRAIENSH